MAFQRTADLKLASLCNRTDWSRPRAYSEQVTSEGQVGLRRGEIQYGNRQAESGTTGASWPSYHTKQALTLKRR